MHNYRAVKRIEWIDCMKGIAIILVVLGHVSSVSGVVNWIYLFHMPLFFLVGGFLYKPKSNYSEFTRKARTILLPYYLWGLLILLYWIIIERHFRPGTGSITGNFTGLILGKYSLLGFNVHLWFLPAFFSVIIISNFMINKLGFKAIGYVTALLIIIYCIGDIPEMFYGLELIPKYMPFYLLGILCRRKHFLDKFIRTDQHLIIGNLIIALACFISLTIIVETSVDFRILWFVTGTIGTIGVFLISQVFQKLTIFSNLGKMSLVILCIHGPVYRVITKVISLICNQPATQLRHSLLMCCVIVTLTLFVCTCLHKILAWLSVGVPQLKFLL